MTDSPLLQKWKLAQEAAADPRLHECDVKLLLKLLDSLDRQEMKGWVGFTTLAKRVRKSRSAVVRSVKTLEAIGYITCERLGGGSPVNTTRYWIGTPSVVPDTSSADATSSADDTSSAHAPDQWRARTPPVAPTLHDPTALPTVDPTKSPTAGRDLVGRDEETAPQSDAPHPLWMTGVDYFVSLGKSADAAKKLIGLLRVNLANNDERLVRLLEESKAQADPISWLMAATKRGGKPAKAIYNPTEEEAERENAAALARLGVAA